MSPAEQRNRHGERLTLSPPSCHHARRLLSIPEWPHHTGDSLSAIAAGHVGKRDGWPTLAACRARRSEAVRMSQISPPAPPLPLFRTDSHQEDEICLRCLPQKINLVGPSADQSVRWKRSHRPGLAMTFPLLCKPRHCFEAYAFEMCLPADIYIGI